MLTALAVMHLCSRETRRQSVDLVKINQCGCCLGLLTTPKKLKPASKLDPCPIPRFIYIGLENMTAPKANAERQRSLLANKDAAYGGYDMGM
jgi:hypothetical protein